MMIDTYTGPEPPPMHGNLTSEVTPEAAWEIPDDLGPTMRLFKTGATRHSDEGKLDFEGFLSPQVLVEFGKYMHKNRIQADGELRASDNWQKGIDKDAYAKSLIRHLIDFWLLHRKYAAVRPETGEFVDMKEALCAIIFNASGYLFELLNDDPALVRVA